MMTGKDLTYQEKVNLMFEYLISSPARCDVSGAPSFDSFLQEKLNPVNSSGIEKGDVVYYDKSLYFVREVRLGYLKCLRVMSSFERICQKFDNINKIEKSAFMPEIWDTDDRYEKLHFNVKKINSILVVECTEWFENGKAKKVPGVYYTTSLEDWHPKQVLRTKEVPFYVKVL